MSAEKKSFIANLISKLPDLKDPKTRLRLILYGGALVLVVIFINALFLPLTSNTKFCGLLCHSMKREYYTWQKSSHANITCTACHVKQGIPAFFHEKFVEGPLGMAAEIFGHEAPINAESHLGKEGIPRETCERCHNMVTRNVTPSRIFNEKMYGSGKDKYHNKHLKKGIPCTLCHNRITHKDVNKPEILKEADWGDSKYDKEIIGKEYTDGLSMTEGCFRCHSPSEEKRDHELVKKYRSEKAPKECSTCHKLELLPVGHKDNNWRTEHPKFAKKDLNYCFGCHGEKGRFNFEDKKYCTRCHAESLVDSWQ